MVFSVSSERRGQSGVKRNCPNFETAEVESNHRPLDRQAGALTRSPLPTSRVCPLSYGMPMLWHMPMINNLNSLILGYTPENYTETIRTREIPIVIRNDLKSVHH